MFAKKADRGNTILCESQSMLFYQNHIVEMSILQKYEKPQYVAFFSVKRKKTIFL